MAQNVKSNKNKQNKHNKKNHPEKSVPKAKAAKKKSSICCVFLSIIVITGICGGLVLYDVNSNGGKFENSNTGRILKQYGALPYVETAWYTTMSNGARAFKWLEKELPPVLNKVCVASEPYVKLSKDISKILRNSICTGFEAFKDSAKRQLPVAAAFIERYVPGMPNKIEQIAEAVSATSSDIYESSYGFLKTKVFVGSFSPENLTKALNETQIAASKYYSWFCEKVDVYAKIN